MANMSYCRFENTYHDFEDCKEQYLALANGEDADGEVPEPLSMEERSAADAMLDSIVDMFYELGIEIDSDDVDAAKKAMGLIS